MNLSDEEIQENILTGRYRLHWFATSQWIALTKRCVEKPKDLSVNTDLLNLLTQLAAELRNQNFIGQKDLKDVAIQSISTWPEISQIIGGVLQFRLDDRHTDWNFTNGVFILSQPILLEANHIILTGSTWVNFDPSILSSTSVRIFESLESLVCDEGTEHRNPCHCTTLQKHYGAKMFKCIFPSCHFNRQGFNTRKDRNTHIKCHCRPWKCSVASCEFAVIGFGTMRARDEHGRNMHQTSSMSLESVNIDVLPLKLSLNDFQVFLFELTKAGNVDGVQKYVRHVHDHEWVLRPARILAATMGSLPLVEILCPGKRWLDHVLRDFFSAVVKSENVDLFRWLLNKLDNFNDDLTYSSLASAAFATESPDIYTEWENFLLDSTRLLGCYNDKWRRKGHGEVIMLMPEYHKRSVLFSNAAFKVVGKNTVLEARLIETWRRLVDVLGGPLDPHFLGWSLTCLAQSTLSITLATELLHLGAFINFPRLVEAIGISRPKGITALHYASRGTSEQAVRFARFLLENGAEPDLGFGGIKPAQEPGAALMQKWLGETWQEVVKRTASKRSFWWDAEGRYRSRQHGDDGWETEPPRMKRRRVTTERQEYYISDDGKDDATDN